MHPNTFLRTFWRMEWDPVVFVAMSFDTAYSSRFTDVFTPAIESLSHNGNSLRAKRVDLSSSGDSIISEINDGIAHSQLVLADVSITGRDAVSGKGYRNANVLYEVGIALSCRRPEDVLLVRDDHDNFLFDVSTIPHATIDFTDTENAKTVVAALLESRLAEQNFQLDARVSKAIRRLSIDEIYMLVPLAEKPDHEFPVSEQSVLRRTGGLLRLLDAELLENAGPNVDGNPVYRLTAVGKVVGQRLLVMNQTK